MQSDWAIAITGLVMAYTSEVVRSCNDNNWTIEIRPD